MMQFLQRFHWLKSKPQKTTKIQELINMYRLFKPKSLDSVFSSDKSISRLSSIEKNIVAYKNLLSECISKMHRDELISIQIVGKDAEEILKRDFFVSKEGFYLNPVESATEFIDQVIMFLELYELLEEKQEKSFNTQKNLYTVQKIAANLMTLVNEL